MKDNCRAFFTTLMIMIFLFAVTLFVTTATVKASQRVKSLVDRDLKLTSLIKKSAVPKYNEAINPDTSIHSVNFELQ